MNVSAPERSAVTGYKSRHVAKLSNAPLLGRTRLAAAIQKAASSAPTSSDFPNLSAFLQNPSWVSHYFAADHSKAQYKSYEGRQTGVFRLDPISEPLTFAIAADWGTGTEESAAISTLMKNANPDCTIHLGDVYFMGEKDEISENCLCVSRNGFKGVQWPLGKQASFALMGNHEMYSGGRAYFNSFLERLGTLDTHSKVVSPQTASYFCVDAEDWIILGLDTGYHSGGFPPLTNVPLINKIPFLDIDARFDDRMLFWLHKTMKAFDVRRPVLILTHHQPVSAFEHSFSKPRRQLEQSGLFAGRKVVWLFGHEHRLAIYQEQTDGDTLVFHPRCIGHGGMPVDLTKDEGRGIKVLFVDRRSHQIDNAHPKELVGYNGFALVRIDNQKLTIEYKDIENTILFAETFDPN